LKQQVDAGSAVRTTAMSGGGLSIMMESEVNSILLLTDGEYDFSDVKHILNDASVYKLASVASMDEGIALLRDQSNIGLVLMHMDSTSNRCFQAVRQLKSYTCWADVPVLFLAEAGMDHERCCHAFDLGVVDVITNPLHCAYFRAKVSFIVEMFAHKRNLLLERKQRQKAESDRRFFCETFDSSSEGMIFANAEKDIAWVNTALSQKSGYTADELIGQPLCYLGSNIDRENAEATNCYDAMWSYLQGHDLWQGKVFNRAKDDVIYSECLKVAVIRDQSGSISGYVGSFLDASTEESANEELYHLAHHDMLTGLPNRAHFNDRLKTELLSAKRRKTSLAVLFLDLDHFKQINDTLGHAVGDGLLKEVANRLSASVRENDLVARQGGDEFVGILIDLANDDDAAFVAERMLKALKEPILVEGKKLSVSCSIGISIYLNDADDKESLINHADAAMYYSKEDGRGVYNFYTDELQKTHNHRIEIARLLRQALDNDEFELFYQPQIDVRTRKVVGVESLIRWHSPELGMVSPLDFIPIAEESGLIIEIGDWVLRTACKQGYAWSQAGYANLMVAVNLSSVQFKEEYFIDKLIQIVCETKISPQFLELELTESIIMKDDEKTLRTLHEIHECGIHLSIDDFGTGYSSMSYLKHFPIDQLKIDRAFVTDVHHSSDDAAIVLAMINLGHSLNLGVIAEGVEEESQLKWLKKHGCDEIQGYYFSRPLPADEISEFLEKTGVKKRSIEPLTDDLFNIN